MPKTIRVGIAGAGFIGAVHAKAYLQVPDVEIVGIADPIESKAEPLAKLTNSRVFRDYDELLGAGIDVINVCLPPSLHLGAAQAAARAGTHILMEKPISRTVEEANAMLEDCRRAGVYLMTGFTHHFYPEMLQAKQWFDSGVIGKPLIVLDNMSITHGFVLPWYRDNEIAGGGVFMCNAVHGIDRASWVLNQQIKAVSALIQPWQGRAAEDYGAGIARFDGGTQGNFFQHWGPYRTLQCELQIFGEEGMIHVRSWESAELLIGAERTVKHFYKADAGLTDRSMIGMISELDEMCNSVREKRAPSVPGEAGREALKVVLAMYRASETGQWVDVQEPVTVRSI